MRVQGEKRRVVLSAQDMEPTEAKPGLRIAPVAALCVWFGSMAIATAIYFEWVPAHALFESEPSASEGSEQDAGARAARAPVERHFESADRQPPQPPRASSDERKSAEPPKFIKTKSKPEPARVIRGSYHSDSHWAAGW